MARRRPLPGGRAVVGGLLVAVAAVGTFGAYANASADHRVGYVVAGTALSVGQRVTPVDLATAPMDLPPALAQRLAFRDPARLIGALVVSPLQAGELIQVSDVVAGSPGAGSRELSFPISSSRAVNGTLQPGDRIDILATYGSGSTATTLAVVRGVTVVARSDAATALGSGDEGEVITVALPDSAQTLALAQAVNAAQIVLVRSTGATRPDDSGTYPPGAPLPTPTAGSAPATAAGSAPATAAGSTSGSVAGPATGPATGSTSATATGPATGAAGSPATTAGSAPPG